MASAAYRLVYQRSLSHDNAVYWTTFSADGKKLATASLDNTVKLWNVSDGRHLATLQGHKDGVRSVAIKAESMKGSKLDGSGTK